MERSSGILMHISSLPGPYGIGTLGKSAYEYADFLRSAGQKYWQLLPVGPTSYGNSPYLSYSSMAGNPYFIDLDTLVEEGLLEEAEINSVDWGRDETKVDYGKLYENRIRILKLAADRGCSRDYAGAYKFLNDNPWVDSYAKFMALKEANDMHALIEWNRKDYDKDLEDVYWQYIYIQLMFFKQWSAFKEYVNELGIKLIGDIPIYVPLDSVDVWAEPEQFQLDEENLPIDVSGVPPDYYSKTGQLWGTPLYDYEYMAKDGYSWWIRRIDGLSRMFDVIRIDHFRGFDEYWAIPYGSKNAMNGKWKKGPGIDLVSRLISWFPQIEFIAENLGVQSESLKTLLDESGLPGMKVLQFGCETGPESTHLIHTHGENCICYTGTHDNPTLQQWKEEAEPKTLVFTRDYFGIYDDEHFNECFIRGCMSSPAKLFVAPMQDWLNLGSEGLMNVPQTVDGNWLWRMKSGAASKELARKIRHMTVTFNR